MASTVFSARQVVVIPFPFSEPAKLFTAHASLIRSVIGHLTEADHLRVADAVIQLLRDGAMRAV